MYKNKIYTTDSELIDEYKRLYKMFKETHNLKLLRQLKNAVYSLDCNEIMKDRVWNGIVDRK